MLCVMVFNVIIVVVFCVGFMGICYVISVEFVKVVFFVIVVGMFDGIDGWIVCMLKV